MHLKNLIRRKKWEPENWKWMKQPNPPFFGGAKRLPQWCEKWIISRRLPLCEKIHRQSRRYCEFVPGMVSIVLLSCKRFPEFRRLLSTLQPFFEKIESYKPIEKIHVDNNSGLELVNYSKQSHFFDHILAHPKNLGMSAALNDAYQRCRGEFILLIEEDFVVDFNRPFLKQCLELFHEYPEIGIIRLKNLNNWWKPFRRIGKTLRKTSSGVEFWTWYPSWNKEMNVWACGSVLFRKVSFASTGLLPLSDGKRQAYFAENVYARKYNRVWLAAKIKDYYPFFQPNDNAPSPGFSDIL